MFTPSKKPNEAAVPATARPLLTGPKRQHFLPRFYLENFSAHGLLAVFDREQNTVRLQQPLNTGVVGHFYTMEDTEGRKRFEVEQLLSDWEGKAKPVIEKLAARSTISSDERSELAVFVALAATRTPDVIDSVKAFNASVITDVMKMMFIDVDEVAKRLREDVDYAGKSDDEVVATAKSMVEMAQNDGVKVNTVHSWAVRESLRLSSELALIFKGRDWVVVHRGSEKRSFITTDSPVLLTTVAPRSDRFWGVGFGNADALVLFPLTESCALVMSGDNGGLRHAEAGMEKIRRINLMMAAGCQRFVIGRDEALVRSLTAAARLGETKWEPCIQRA